MHEEISTDEFIQLYNDRAKEVYELDNAINQGKSQLKSMGAFAETEELKKFVQMLIQAEEIKKKQNLILELQRMETQLAAKKKELERLTPAMKEVNEGLKKPKDGSTKVPKDAGKAEKQA